MNRKSKSIILSAALLVLNGNVGAAQLNAEPDPGVAKTTFTERISDDQLRALQKARAAVRTATPAPPPPSYGIVEMSDFIAFDGFSTLVPKDAILNVPVGLRSNIAKGPTGKLLIWSEFLTRNRARITPFEITLEQAVGKTPIEPKRLDQAVRTGMIIVAVIHGSPTSVHRPAKPSPSSAPAAATTSSR